MTISTDTSLALFDTLSFENQRKFFLERYTNLKSLAYSIYISFFPFYLLSLSLSDSNILIASRALSESSKGIQIDFYLHAYLFEEP